MKSTPAKYYLKEQLTSKTFRSDSNRLSTNLFTLEIAFCISILDRRCVELASQFCLGGSKSIGIYVDIWLLQFLLIVIKLFEFSMRTGARSWMSLNDAAASLLDSWILDILDVDAPFF